MINERKNERIIKDMEYLKISEEMELVVDGEGRYPCRAPGCSKTFAHSGKSRRNHEASHNPASTFTLHERCTNVGIT